MTTFHTTGSQDGFPVEFAHDGWNCLIVRLLGPDEVDDEVGPMYLIRFADGVEVDAFADELDDIGLPSAVFRADPELRP